ncbi:imidazolonepropionase [Mesoaciditoga lauensis]|uniref:imidazolonepropionase n=1 Tax=Mesoaciditoga lauensis TaxID=1495039 RepID=UPI00056932A6|nr:imidazolonepropionase [Mesoaciditoga lauensis]
MKSADLSIKNLRIATPLGQEPSMGDVKLFEGCLSVSNGKIVSVGECLPAKEEMDGKGMFALPGFVDAHTHIPFVGERSGEFILRAEGKSYEELLKNGGGIYSTVKVLRKASVEQLTKSGTKHAAWFLKAGVTSFECKSGYGLNEENEIKQLMAAKKMANEIPQDIVTTFLGAHAVPPQGEKAYLRELIETLKRVKEEGLAEFVDVFCDEGAFSVEFSTELLRRAKELGFKIRAHAEELSSNGFASVASELGAVSVDHLLKIKEEEMSILAKNGTVAVLMPTTSFFLKTDYAPARKLIEHGVFVALGSDFNPGSSTFYSPIFTIHLAVNHLGMSVEEAITAHTLNSAYVLGLSDEVGTIEVGKKADFVLLDIPTLNYIPYMPTNEMIKAVFKDGRKVFENKDNLSW